MQTYFRLPVFSASPQRVSPPAGDTQRDGGQLTDASYIVLDELIQEQVKALQTQLEKKKVSADVLNSQITTSLEAFEFSPDFLKSIPDSNIIVKASYVYRSIMDKLMESLEKNTPVYDEITLSREKEAPNKISIQMGIGKKRNTPPVSVLFSPLVQEISTSTPWLTTFQKGLKGHDNFKNVSSSEDSIDVTWWVKEFIRQNGRRRKRFIKTKDGGQLTAPFIKALCDTGLGYKEIAQNYPGTSISTLSTFMIQKAGTRIRPESRPSIQKKQTLEALLKPSLELRNFSGDATSYRVTTLKTQEILDLLTQEGESFDLSRLCRYLHQMNILTSDSYQSIENRLIILQTLHNAGHKTGSLVDRLASFVQFCDENNCSLTKGAEELGLSRQTIDQLLDDLELPKPKTKYSGKPQARLDYIQKLEKQGLEKALDHLQPPSYREIFKNPALAFDGNETAFRTWISKQRKQITAKIHAQKTEETRTNFD
jgi:hypothetical protein